ncbi:hypothetical protein ABPG74_011349 [Tetrahymena malaccensis]
MIKFALFNQNSKQSNNRDTKSNIIIKIMTLQQENSQYYTSTINQIDDVVNSINSELKIQIKTSQYNIKQKAFQTAFRYSQIYTLSNQYIQGTLKVQQQTTTVKEGLFFQSEVAQVSPLQYDFEVQTLDRQSAISLMNLSCYCQAGVVVDQLYSLQEQILDRTSGSEDKSDIQENETVIDKSNSLSPTIYFKPIKMLNNQNQAKSNDETLQSIQMQSQIQQKDERSMSFQSFKEPNVESCNQSKEFLQMKNQFSEKQFHNKSCFSKQVLEIQKNNQKANQQIAVVQKKQNPIKNQQTKKLNNKKQQQEEFSKYNHIIKSLQNNKAQCQLQKILNKSSELRLENTKKFLQRCQEQNNLSITDLRILSSIKSSIQ